MTIAEAGSPDEAKELRQRGQLLRRCVFHEKAFLMHVLEREAGSRNKSYDCNT